MISRKVPLLILAVLIVLIAGTSCFAYECPDNYRNSFTAPVCTDAKYIFWSGAAITAGLYAFKDGYVEETAKRSVAKDHLKNWGVFGGRLGGGYLNSSYILGQLLLGGKSGKGRAGHMLEASLYTLGTTIGMKKAIHETRPGYLDDHDSFPSGHSSFSFSFASVVAAQHGWYWGGGAYLVSSFIAFSRMDENWHYIHDVVAGIAIGSSYAWGIYYNQSKGIKDYWFSLLPTDDLSGARVAWGYSF
jgi:hypothetical protein